MKSKPKECAERALRSLNHGYYPVNSRGKDLDESDIIDLVTDLMHLAGEYEMDVESILRCAKSNFEAETV